MDGFYSARAAIKAALHGLICHRHAHRAECLNAHWFLTLDDARRKMEHWRRDYNEVHPHSAIGNKPPISLMNGSGASHPP